MPFIIPSALSFITPISLIMRWNNWTVAFFSLMTSLQCMATPSDKKNGSITPTQKEFRISISKTSHTIKVDGILDDEAWQTITGVTNFYKKYPNDEGTVTRQTLVKTTFDDKFIYFGVVAYDSGNAFIQTLKRDAGHDGSDGIAIVLDPLNQHANGFFFVVNAFNAQSEDLLSASGGEGPNFSWDNKWFSSTSRHGDKWVAEIAIPFKTLRYHSDQNTWGVNFVRIDTKTNEYSCWTKMPLNFNSYDLGYTGALVWEQLPPKPGSNIVFLPYVTGMATSEKTNQKNQYNSTANAGFDAKIGLTSALNLDLTVNPDFSQIEVDQQVTNFTRFNIFLPELRTFFLENGDLYSSYGIPSIRPFYSRTIGLDSRNLPVPILGGIRLTGNATPSTRIGLMNMQTGNKGDYKMENYTAASVNQRVFKRSVVKGYFLNRQGFLNDEEKKQNPMAAFGRNAGTEFTYTSVAGNFSAWGSYHKSFKPNIHNKDVYSGLGAEYTSRKFKVMLDAVDMGTNYYTDMGFVQRIENYDADKDTTVRLGFRQLFSQVGYNLFPKKGRINTHSFELENFIVWNPDGTLNERSHDAGYFINFRNTAMLRAGASLNQVNLIFPISFTEGKPLPKGEYHFLRGQAGFESDYRKKWQFNADLRFGQFYNGHFTTLQASIIFRHPPHIGIAVVAEYNILSFPGEYGSSKFLLISPRINLNFTTSIFWTTFLQYNTQANNFNINSRFQWRFKPMSDIFLVYTDNYFTTPLLKNKNRALVLKLNYWFNL